jgi:Ca2+-binding RTX toxin-like protein
MQIFGTSKSEYLIGTFGSDLFMASGGNDLLDGRTGRDTVSYADWGGPVSVTLGAFGADGSATKNVTQQIFGTWYTFYNSTDTLRSIENVVGSRFNDTITGNEEENVLVGLGGGDALNGGGGRDTVDYSASDASVTANLSASFGQGGHAEGDSYQSIEDVVGSAFRDTLIGSAGANKLEGKGDRDFLNGLDGGDILDGGEGIDTVGYTFSPSSVNVNLTTNLASGGHASGDTLISIENVSGSAHFDILTGNGEANTLRGEGSTDWLAGLAGADHLDGGEGEDLADYRASAAPVTVNLAGNFGLGGDAAGDTYASIEKVSGSEYGDTLTGSADNNQLDGLGGGDTLAGLQGADRIYGGEGIDTADYSLSAGGSIFNGVTVNLLTGQASGDHAEGDTFISIENLIGSSQNDVLTGNNEANVLEGRGLADTLAGLGGADTLIGGDDTTDDTADYSASPEGVTINLETNVNLFGHAAGDKLIGIEQVLGTKYNDTITGNEDHNFLNGSDGADRLDGGKGRDDLFGGAGKDTLIGGLDGDTLTGGTESDVFLYNAAAESPFAFDGSGNQLFDRIRDFAVGVDKLDLRLVDANILVAGDQAFTFVEAFSGAAGQLMITDPVGTGDGLEQSLLLADLNGDAQADFAIEFFGNVPPGAAAITPFDILL